MRRSLALPLLAAAAALAGCGADEGQRPATVASTATPSPQATASARTSKPAAPSRPSPLPSVDVSDLRTGDTIALASLGTTRKPLLVWFWAPY